MNKWQIKDRIREIEARLSFAAMLMKLDDEKYTGPVIMHFLHGKPKLVDVTSERFVLDNGRR